MNNCKKRKKNKFHVTYVPSTKMELHLNRRWRLVKKNTYTYYQQEYNRHWVKGKNMSVV